jgi:hypothetical protein
MSIRQNKDNKGKANNTMAINIISDAVTSKKAIMFISKGLC